MYLTGQGLYIMCGTGNDISDNRNVESHNKPTKTVAIHFLCELIFKKFYIMEPSARIKRLNEWKKVKGSGTFRRLVKKERDLTLAILLNTGANVKVSPIEYSRTPLQEKLRSPSPHESRSPSPVPSSFPSPSDMGEADSAVTDWTDPEDEYFSPNPSEDEAEDDECEKPQQPQTLGDFLRDWAIQFNIAQAAMKPLMERLRTEFAVNLPMDPRTVMRMYFV